MQKSEIQRNPFKPLPCDFKSLYLNPRFSDFLLYFPNAIEEKFSKIPVHRFLLDARSNYFHNFFQEMPTEEVLTICFPQWCTKSIFDVLHYFYTSQNIELTDQNIAAVCFISHVWGCEELLQQSMQYILKDLQPKHSLDTLIKLNTSLNHNSQGIKKLIELTAQNLYIFDASEVSKLPYDIFDSITELVYTSKPEDALANALCNCIEKYVTTNIGIIGKHEFEILAQRFTTKTYNGGIITLMKYANELKWGVQICRQKILHIWCHLDQKRLAELPLDTLYDFLKENYINARSEDEIFKFILLACDTHKGEDVSKLWNQLRVPILSEQCKKDIENYKNNLDNENTNINIPDFIIEQLHSSPTTLETRRVPRSATKCLVLGAADQASLNDVVQLLVFSGFHEKKIVARRADHEIDPSLDFNNFHVIFVFGFYKFANRECLSKRIAEFVSHGGGLVVAFGSYRPDGFGLGEPVQSLLPIDAFHKETVTKQPPSELIEEKEMITVGCKHMRMLFDARRGSIVVAQWEDGVPFIVKKPKSEKRGGIVVINGTPVSSDIIPEQWSKHDKNMSRLLTNAIVSVSNCCCL